LGQRNEEVGGVKEKETEMGGKFFSETTEKKEAMIN
jgi:hypothetical protein